MVEYIKKDEVSNIILTGTGGSGKSMFTRYLWLSLFVESGGKIPLFLELRNLNSISSDNLIVYIQQTISNGQASISEKETKEHLVRGDFVIILDGFDELVQEKKEVTQKQIMSLCENYRKTKIILTSRPDSRFISWPSFEVVQVEPLEKKDVVELIELAEFSEDSKKLFLKRFKDAKLFDKHKSFLINPLLASMMLLTFSHNFDIPERMYLFYQQAFDALYQRHDSYKPGGFTRQFSTSLSEDGFKRVVAYFCLITYFDQEFIFTRETALLALNKAIDLAGAQAKPAQVLEDLILCICFLIEDGLQLVFAHRSFQEYFSAYCMAYLVPQRVIPLITKFAKRVNDQVVPLLADMSPEVFRERYVIPMGQQFITDLQINSRRKSVVKFLESLEACFTLEVVNVHPTGQKSKAQDDVIEYLILLEGESEFHLFVNLLQRIFNRKEITTKVQTENQRRDRSAVFSIVELLGATHTNAVSISAKAGKFVFSIAEKRISNNSASKKLAGNTKRLDLGVANYDTTKYLELVKIFRQSNMYSYLIELMNFVASYVSNEMTLARSASEAMDKFFSN